MKICHDYAALKIKQKNPILESDFSVILTYYRSRKSMKKLSVSPRYNSIVIDTILYLLVVKGHVCPAVSTEKS